MGREGMVVWMEGLLYVLGAMWLVMYGEESKGQEVEVSLMGIMGMVLLVWSEDLVGMYLGMEMVSLTMYMIVSRSEVGSGMKYMMLGMLSSAIVVGGIVLVYMETGTTNYEVLRMVEGGVGRGVIMGGMLFKLGIPPMHSWMADVYEGVEMKITGWLGIMGKLGYVMAVYKMGGRWGEWLVAGALIVGSVGGLSQNRIRRMLAYSGIGSMGYIMLGMMEESVEGRIGMIFYNLQYWISMVGVFAIMVALGQKGGGVRYISTISRERSILMVMLMLNMLSLLGIPPLVGFYGKMEVLRGGVMEGYVGLVSVAVVTSVISAGYYLGVVKEGVMTAPAPSESGKEMEISRGLGWIISVTGLWVVLCGVKIGGILGVLRMVCGME